jgi:hypothetical protein
VGKIISDEKRRALEALRRMQHQEWASSTPEERLRSCEELYAFAVETAHLRPPQRDRRPEKFAGILRGKARLRALDEEKRG